MHVSTTLSCLRFSSVQFNSFPFKSALTPKAPCWDPPFSELPGLSLRPSAHCTQQVLTVYLMREKE